MRSAARAAQSIRAGGQAAPVPQVSHAPASLVALLDLCATYMTAEDLQAIVAAYAVAEAAHAGALRRSGEPYIEHPLAVATILAELAMDAAGLCAALLHDTVEDTSVTLEGVRRQFGTTVASLVDGVTKFTAVEAPHDEPLPAPEAQSAADRKRRQQVETVRKLFVSMIADPRIVLLKLADRLHNLRTLGAMSTTQRERTARETLDIYGPLAGRIGLYSLKGELEDLAFFHLDPEAYTRTVQRLRDEEMKRRPWAERLRTHLLRELTASGIAAAVNWRVKHAYRAYTEASENGMDVALLHDILAFRVLVEEVPTCYQALGVVHQLWHPHAERIRDYISGAKANGYQSLHTAVFALDGRLAQLHIRTHTMHRAAQHGIACYWLDRALAGAHTPPEAQPWLRERPRWVKQVLDWHQELSLTAHDFVDVLRREMLEEQIIVHTPRGDRIELPPGATVLDFAYKVHTKIGDRAVGARIQTTGLDGMTETHTVGIGYALAPNDVVLVLTDATAQPQAEWLHLARTHYALERVRRALRVQQRAAGQTTPRLGDEAVEHRLQHPSGKPAVVRLGRCCLPCPGDEIVGLADAARGITAHRSCCATLRLALARRARQGGTGEPLPLTWQAFAPQPYRLRLAIYGQDYSGLMHVVSSCVAQMDLSVAESAARAHADRHKAAITLTLIMPPEVRRESVLRRLRAVPGVTHVERDLRKGCGNEHGD